MRRRQPGIRRLGYGERMNAAWRFVYVILYPIVSALFKTTRRHLEQMPKDGGVIVVTNHVSHVDPFLVAKVVFDAGRTPQFLAKDTIFRVPVVK